MFTPQIAAWLVLAIWLFWTIYFNKSQKLDCDIILSTLLGTLFTICTILILALLIILFSIAFGVI